MRAIGKNPLVYVVGFVVLADAIFWWLASRLLDHPSVSAALIGSASGLLVATVGIISAVVGSRRALDNSLALFESQIDAERSARFLDDKRQACGTLLTWATAYMTARERTKSVDEALAALRAKDDGADPNGPVSQDLLTAVQRVKEASTAERAILERMREARWSLALLAPSMESDLTRLMDEFSKGTPESLDDCRRAFLLAAHRELDVNGKSPRIAGRVPQPGRV